MLQVCCSVLQYIAMCYSVLQCVALWNTQWCTGGVELLDATPSLTALAAAHSNVLVSTFRRPPPHCTETYLDTRTYSHTHRHIYMDTHP